MSSAKPEPSVDAYDYIDLDEPTRWWSSLIGLVVIVLIAAVLVAPWVIELDDGTPANIPNPAVQNSTSICRPDSSGLPGIFDPSVASWGRFCEWFIDPPTNNTPGDP